MAINVLLLALPAVLLAPQILHAASMGGSVDPQYEGILIPHLLQKNRSSIEKRSASIAAIDYTKNKQFTWDKFHRLSDIHFYMYHFEHQYLGIAEVKIIGKSYEGRDLLVMKLGRKKRSSKKSIWIDGGMHAREWISPAVATYLIRELQQDDELLEKMDFYVMPVMNPDGYEYSHTTDRLWRKTRSMYGPRDDCIGVDPNRNWDSHWGETDSVRATDPCSPVFQGLKPFSEPETKATSDFILNLLPHVYVSIHSHAQQWIRPWGYTNASTRGDQEMTRVSLKAVEAIRNVSGFTYDTGTAFSFRGNVAGNSMDWAYEKAGVQRAFTIELRDSDIYGEHGFAPPASEIVPTGREIFAAIKEAVSGAKNIICQNILVLSLIALHHVHQFYNKMTI